MQELPPFADYVLKHQLDQIAAIYLARARETKLSLLDLFAHLSDQQIIAHLKQNFAELLESFTHGTAHEHALQAIKTWKDNKFPGVKRDQPGLHDLIQVIGIRKYSFIKVLPTYTKDLEKFSTIIIELNSYYDFYREKVYEAYIHMQQEELQNEKEFIETVLDTTVEGISAVDTNFHVLVWNKALTQRTGIKKEDILGKYIFDFFKRDPQSEDYKAIQKAQTGETVLLENMPLQERTGYYEMNVVPLKNKEGAILGSISFSRDITRRKQQEAQLQASLNYYLQILDDFPALIWRSGTDAQCDYFNQSWLQFTGRALEQELGDGWTEGVHPDDLPRFLNTYRSHFQAREPFSMEYRLRHQDGSYRWLVDIGKPIYDLQGNFTGFLGTCFDIQDRKEAEQQIQETNHELAAALEELRSAEEQLLQTNRELEQRIEERTRELAASEEELKQMLDHTLALNKEKEDLLAREKAAYAEAEMQKNRLYHLFMQVPSLVSITRGRNFVYELANPKYLEVLGIEPPVEGKKLTEVMPHSFSTFINILYDVLDTGQRFIGQEIPIKSDWSKSGRPYNRYFNLIYEPIKNAEGITDGLITFGYEVSEQVKSREKLQELNYTLHAKNEELVRINNDLDNFIYTASHDLKSPIVNLEGLMGILEGTLKEKLNEKERKVFGMMEASIRKLKETISYLSDVTKVAKGLEDKAEVVVVSEVVAEVKHDIANLIQESQPTITAQYHVEKLVLGRGGFRSIVYNLLSNAIKYRSPKRPLAIHIETHEEDGIFVFSVRDNGLGIRPEQQSKLFTMFRRLHTHVEGTGIGLYIVKRIVENVGGRVTVESRADEGSQFNIYIPKTK